YLNTPNSGTGNCNNGSPDALSGGTLSCGTAPCVSGGLKQLSSTTDVCPSSGTQPAGCLPNLSFPSGPTNTAQNINGNSCTNYPSGCTATGVPQCNGKNAVALAPGTYNGIAIS